MEYKAPNFKPKFLYQLKHLITKPIEKLLGNKISKWILPSQRTSFLQEAAEDRVKELFREFTKSSNALKFETAYVADIELHKVITFDNAMLTVYWLHPLRRSPQNEHYTVHFLGNSEYAENRDTLKRFFKECSILDRNVIVFNYRGVGASIGELKSWHNLLTDGFSVIEFLLANGASADKIVLTGNSLGASCATSLAAYYNNSEKKGMRLFNKCGFVNMEQATTGLLIRNVFDYFNYSKTGAILGWLVKTTIIKPLLWLTNWNINSKKDFMQLPGILKGGIYIEHPKEEIDLQTRTGIDGIIHKSAALGPKVNTKKQVWITPLLSDLRLTILGHNQNLSDLTNWEQTATGEDVYYDFLSNYHKIILQNSNKNTTKEKQTKAS